MEVLADVTGSECVMHRIMLSLEFRTNERTNERTIAGAQFMKLKGRSFRRGEEGHVTLIPEHGRGKGP